MVHRMRYTMPAKAPLANKASERMMSELANCIRQRRLSLGVSAVVAAYTAGMSRVTWHRIENAQPSVTMGAYLSALEVLGLDIELKPREVDDSRQESTSPVSEDGNIAIDIPLSIPIQNYPQLRQIAWHIKDDFELTPAEAFGLYERNRRHLDMDQMQVHELELLKALENSALEGKYAI